MQTPQKKDPEQDSLHALGASSVYRGRFAPSPSGPLHFGSLIAALTSYLDAKANQGQWLVRMEDIDTPRVVSGAADAILTTLEAYGLHWDGEVIYQSQRHKLYHEVLHSLASTGDVYACACTRKQIKQRGGFYDNHCRTASHVFENNALRLKQNFPIYQFEDALQGHVVIPDQVAQEDYIVKRRDGLYAYQLVVVVDDIEQQISHVVRGADLLEPTARQLSLFQQLAKKPPHYMHVPLAVAQPGFKLSKQNYAPAIDNNAPLPALKAALGFLGFDKIELHQIDDVTELLTWATAVYHDVKLPKNKEIQVIQLSSTDYQFTPL
ncbi:tRNA glutamyl-Q(34) synthetase GluQRS [Pseudoalteromonas obscura]|uniref:Glutamyl-Q tRNA(Asp) synthetase n=1 Tax=Pseudoalteromonas obscura TaxID=3048491 RepID=A0ABT7ELN0_9GAMM|nr:tRNA glutamyl-Q(34) synthetase GluQRS [Pseudoalteromonas sp. P94(2023)]MDK2595910.1 tRNA glutamyl-Q(34) synthetase GluQRS [Pseudoalteromonas sp. P94(2023)]